MNPPSARVSVFLRQLHQIKFVMESETVGIELMKILTIVAEQFPRNFHSNVVNQLSLFQWKWFAMVDMIVPMA